MIILPQMTALAPVPSYPPAHIFSQVSIKRPIARLGYTPTYVFLSLRECVNILIYGLYQHWDQTSDMKEVTASTLTPHVALPVAHGGATSAFTEGIIVAYFLIKSTVISGNR